MKRSWVAFLIGLLVLPVGLIQAQGGGTPIGVANASQVVQLARFGRGWVLDVDWSPDGNTLLLASSVGLWLYDTSDFSAPPTLFTGHEAAVASAAFSPDGLNIISGGRDGDVRLWDSSGTSTALEIPTGLIGIVVAVAYSPDGSLAASSRAGSALYVWDATGTHRFTSKEHSRVINALAFSPDGSLLASASDDKSVRLWDATTGTVQLVIEHTSAVKSVAFSPDGTLLAGGDSAGDVVLWDPQNGEQVGLLDWERGTVNDLAFSPDGTLLTTANEDGNIRVWDVASATLEAEWEGQLGYEVIALAYSPDGTALASVDSHHGIYVWDMLGNQAASLPGHTRQALSAAFSPDANLVLDSHNDDTVYLRNRIGDDTNVIYTTRHSSDLPGRQTLGFSPDGRLYASASLAGVYIWEVATGAEIGRVIDPSVRYDFLCFAFSPDSQLIAGGTRRGLVVLWDIANQTIVATLTGHTDDITSVDFSPDGTLLLTSSYDGTVRLWGLP